MQGSALVAVLIVAGIAVAWWFGSKRRKVVAAWAASKGWQFDPTRDRGFDERNPDFNCLRRGHSRYAYNVTSGTWNDRGVVAFDYHYATGHGKNRHDFRFSAIVLDAAVDLKPLHIRSENVFDKLTELFGIDDIDFESAEFSRAFRVKSPDKRWAYDVLHQRTMEFLLSQPRFGIQFGDREVIVWRNRKFSPETYETAIGVAEGILDRLPDYVVREQGGRQ
ncbi:MAG: hypothetical protein WBC63_08115 [Candidatus Bipolaricaulia bacterium]